MTIVFLGIFAFLLCFGLFLQVAITKLLILSLLASFIGSIIIQIAINAIYLKPLTSIQKAVHQMLQGGVVDRLVLPKRTEFFEISRDLNELSLLWQRRIQKITGDESEMEAILSSMVEGVVVINVDEHIRHMSPNFRDMLELRSTQTNHRRYWEVISNQEINRSIKEALQERKAIRREIDITSGKTGVFSMQISPVIVSNGQLSSVVAVFHDISHLKKLERMRTEFVANVSHELKTPLTSIKGFLETLLGGAMNEPVAAKRFLDIMSKQTERLENLVKDLLILSAIESKEVKLDLVAQSLDPIINNVVHLQKANIDLKGHVIRLDLQASQSKVIVDRVRIEQVLINLLENAIKFTDPKGVITIRTLCKDSFLVLEVADTGIGIPSGDLPRIFERFFRVDKARSESLGGTGLGLAIVKHIVQAHGGKVDVQSVLNQGTTFAILLPLAKS